MPATSPAPTASIVLLAYNQEGYVEAAMEAALAQDFPDFELIVSDDGSQDGTFDRIEHVAARHADRHRVVTNRTRVNRGIVAHYHEAVRLARGRYIVGMAGDDISEPNRVARLVERFEATGADCVFSSWKIIDSDGQVIGVGKPANQGDINLARYFPGREVRQISGVSAAYRRDAFIAIHPPEEPVFAEDFLFTLMLNYRSRRIEWLDEPLVRYRVHGDALTHRASAGQDAMAIERSSRRIYAGTAAVLRHFERAVRTGVGFDPAFGDPAAVDLDAVRSDLAFEEFRARWIEASPVERLRALLRTKSRAQARWVFARLFGPRGFALAKRLRDGARSLIGK